MRRIIHILKDADSAAALAIIEAQARQGDRALHVLLIQDAVRRPPTLPAEVKVSVLADYQEMLRLIFDADSVITW